MCSNSVGLIAVNLTFHTVNGNGERGMENEEWRTRNGERGMENEEWRMRNGE